MGVPHAGTSDSGYGPSGGKNRSRIPGWVVAVGAAGVSGALMAACYWPLNLHFLAWIALVPWLLVVPRLNADKTWLYGTILGLVFYRIGLAWLFKLSGPLGGAIVVDLAILMGLSFRVARLLMDRFGRAAMLWAVPMTFVGQELLRSEALSRYRFAYLGWGYSQSHNLWIAQIASLGGVYFVSFLLVAFSVSIAYALTVRRALSWVSTVVVGTTVLVLALLTQPSSVSRSSSLSTACVQAEVFDDRVYSDLTAQALSAPEKPKFVVLPEHTIATFTTEKHPLVRSLASLAHEHGAFICLGVHTRAPQGAGCDYDNVAMLIDPAGKIIARQAKVVPIPFGEDGNPATQQTTVITPQGCLGIYVCYDGTFTDVPRRLVDQGAQFLLAPLMDPAQWPLQQCWQHADMAPFRSIELRRCAVRAASSGVSQIIDETGRLIAQRSREEGAGVIGGRVHPLEERTIFVRGGYWFARLIGAVFLVVVVVLTLAQWGPIRWFNRFRRVGDG